MYLSTFRTVLKRLEAKLFRGSLTDRPATRLRHLGESSNGASRRASNRAELSNPARPPERTQIDVRWAWPHGRIIKSSRKHYNADAVEESHERGSPARACQPFAVPAPSHCDMTWLAWRTRRGAFGNDIDVLLPTPAFFGL